MKRDESVTLLFLRMLAVGFMLVAIVQVVRGVALTHPTVWFGLCPALVYCVIWIARLVRRLVRRG
jgi:hypothetical protein